MQAFNRGDYQESVEAKRKADAIVSVLYPNDATPEGKLLRLEQQYFFVSASIQARNPPLHYHPGGTELSIEHPTNSRNKS